MFPEANVHHLARTYSDHAPILINLSPISGISVKRPFRFLASWIEHLNLVNLVRKK